MVHEWLGINEYDLARYAGGYSIHKTAVVDDLGSLSKGCIIWHFAHINHGAKLGEDVMIGQGCYVDKDVTIGKDCRIQNGVSIYRGTVLGQRVFVGPNATFTNARFPKAVRAPNDPFYPDSIVIEDDVVIGANATLIAPLVVGREAFVAAGAVVTKDVEPYSIMMGSPARPVCEINTEEVKDV